MALQRLDANRDIITEYFLTNYLASLCLVFLPYKVGIILPIS